MMESSACDLWKAEGQLVSFRGELLDWSVFVSERLEEMARPDWVQKAKHLADTCQAAERESLLQQKHCRNLIERVWKWLLLFRTENERRTWERLGVCSERDGEMNTSHQTSAYIFSTRHFGR